MKEPEKKYRYIRISDKEVRYRVERILLGTAFTILGMVLEYVAISLLQIWNQQISWSMLIILVSMLLLGIFSVSISSDKEEIKGEVKI